MSINVVKRMSYVLHAYSEINNSSWVESTTIVIQTANIKNNKLEYKNNKKLHLFILFQDEGRNNVLGLRREVARLLEDVAEVKEYKYYRKQ